MNAIKLIYQPDEPFIGLTSRFLTDEVFEGERQVVAEFFRQNLLGAEQFVPTKEGIFISLRDRVIAEVQDKTPQKYNTYDDW